MRERSPSSPMAHDVFDHDDRIVDQDADREDQREQADAIDRVAHHPGGEEGQKDCGRNDDSVTTPSRQPIAIAIRTTMEIVASARWNSSSFAFSFAVSP